MRRTAVAILVVGLSASAQSNSREFDALTELMRSPQTSVTQKKAALAAFLAANPARLTSPRMALVFREQESLVKGTPAPAATFFRRVSVEECRRLSSVFRKKPQLVAEPCENVVRWQANLDEGWRATKAEEARRAAAVVIDKAAPLRDEIDALLMVSREPNKYLAELFGSSSAEAAKAVEEFRAVQSMLFELVAEADLLVLEAEGTTGEQSEFCMRYPNHPFVPSALLLLGRTTELVERFPRHPLAKLAAKSTSRTKTP